MVYRTISDLQVAGFEGFIPIRDLGNNCSVIPEVKVVYMVVRTVDSAPNFLIKGMGGFYQGKDPNVSLDILRTNWIDGTCVMYIGQAGGIRKGKQTKSTLCSRLKQYLRFGQGKSIGHRGGRYIWQLKDAADLLVCWKTLLTEDPCTVEKFLISEFKECYAGKRPFANLRD